VTASAASTASLAFLVGRPPTPGSVLHDVRRELTAAGVDVRLHIVDRSLPADLHAGLLVLKDLPAAVLGQLAGLGLPTCNDAAAELRSLDKAAVVRALRAGGLPVPAGRCTADWAEVGAAAALGPVVVKPQVGAQGAGVLLLDGPAPAAPVTPGPWLVQEPVPGDGLDRKLYVTGDRVDGLLRRWPDRGSGDPFCPAPELAELARSAARVLGLELCGVDVLLGPDGPVVVDVNAFPGYKAVPAAAEQLAGHLLARLAGRVATCA